MKNIFTNLFTFLIAIFVSNTLVGQLVINEVCAANYDDYVGTAGDNEDWFEIFNNSATPIDLDSYYLSDDILEPTKFQIPGSVVVPANGYAVIFASGRNEIAGGSVHTNFKITQGKQEYAVLANPAGTIIDTWWLDASNQRNHSFGRVTDGAATWGIFEDPTPNGPNVGAFTAYATKPVFSQEAGLYAGAVSITIDAPGLDIRYTTNGTTPTMTSAAYTAPVNITNTSVLRARAFSSDPTVLPSFIESNTYFIDESHSLKVISIAGDQVTDFINDDAPGAFNSNFEGSFEYFDANFTLIDEGQGDYNKHGNDSWGYDQRGLDFIMRDQFGYNDAIHDQIFALSEKDEFQRLIIKAAANDNYPFSGGAHIRDAYIHELSMRANLKMDERTYEPCIMYVDGEYWGVYELREKADDLDYTEFLYDQGQGNVDYIKTWGGTWSEYGNGEPDWEALVDYILNNDMTDDANYAYVSGELNTGSLIDYFILNSYVVTSDWLNWNTAWWRGTNPDGDHKKWGYVLWDNDASFGHYINYTGIPTQDPDADPCDPETLGDPGGQGHVPILNALFENEDFYQDYVSRYADLSAGALSCDNMHAILDELVGRIAPEMPAQIAKWGGTVAEWEGNVQEIHDFIDERCIEIEEGIVDCYDVEGPFEVTVQIQPPGAGFVEFNTIEITDSPWIGSYYGGLDIDLAANGYGTNIFDHWTLNNHTIADYFSDTASFTFATGDTIIAYFQTTTVDLTLQVEPDGAGEIEIYGMVYDDLPIVADIPEGVDLPVTTNPLGNFYVFDHWEIQNAGTLIGDPLLPAVDINLDGPDVLTAFYNELQILNCQLKLDQATTYDPTISSNSFILTANDTLIAYFEEDPNFLLTLRTDPPEAGDLYLNASKIITLPYTKKFYEEDFFISLDALEEENHDFVNWTSQEHPSVNGNDKSSLSFTLAANDTITANFYAHPFAFWLPNAFSPNEDGINDIWHPHGSSINVDEYAISIFDRYGNILFESEDFNQGWNGDGVNKQGYYSPNAVYSYLLKVQSAIDGSRHEFSGVISLVR